MTDIFNAPPAVTVGDIAVAPQEVNPDVVRACKLVWVSFGLSVLGSASSALYPAGRPQIGVWITGMLVGGVISFFITQWIVTKLKAGRNWMRLLMTIGSVLGYLSILVFWNYYSTEVFPSYANRPIKATVAALGIIPNIGLVVLLNTRAARAWFAAMKKDRR